MARYIAKDDALANAFRATLLEAVAARPGITLTQLADHFGRKPSTIMWHATKLAKADLLRHERLRKVRVFYLVAGGTQLRNAILARSQLDNALARRIHEMVSQRPGITFPDLCAALVHNASVLRWHLRRLVEAGLVYCGATTGRTQHFYPRLVPTAGPPTAAGAAPAA